jgi:hypothetical protein
MRLATSVAPAVEYGTTNFTCEQFRSAADAEAETAPRHAAKVVVNRMSFLPGIVQAVGVGPRGTRSFVDSA